MKKKLPIGIQTFNEIRNSKENFIYIDKTNIALDLVERGKYYFLSRPRRFGKSLFLDTLSELFKGSKHLFEGLAIYDEWDWEQAYPVINISFGSGAYTDETLILKEFSRIFRENNESIGLDIPFENLKDVKESFGMMISECYKKFNKRIVILIDEYDKIILDNIHFEDKTISILGSGILKNFYSTLKDNDRYLKFVFITGVSKFSKLNLFSGLNNIEDITIDERYATITGYTHEDLKKSFSEYLDGVDLEEVKRWYNGYNYFGEPIYNPFDILLFFSKGCKYNNYWWQTGNPAFLIEILKKGNYYLPDLENIIVGEETLNAFDVEYIDIVALLWQTGYLTFDKEIRVASFLSYKMKIPNLEIQNSLNTLFFDYLTNLKTEARLKQVNIARSILSCDLDLMKKSIISIFSSISYTNYVKNNIGEYEGYYASVLYTCLASLGFNIVPEDHTNKGRIDMTIFTTNFIYILEFKVDKSDEAALHQIKAKKYYEKYLLDSRKIFLIGIHFDSGEKNILSFEWEEYFK